MKCQVCGHDSDEHTKEGCIHIDWEQKGQGEADEYLEPCKCEQTPRDIYNQKGNQ